LRRLLEGSSECVKEYARHYIERYGVPEHVFEQMYILDGQKKWEEQLSRTYEIVLSDSPIFLSYIYGRMLADIKDRKQRGYLVRLYELAMESVNEYDAIYLLPPRVVREDGVRTQDSSDAEHIHGLIESFCHNHRVDYASVPVGNYDEQAYVVGEHLRQHHGLTLREDIPEPEDTHLLAWLKAEGDECDGR
jgi:hypothetical protein